MYQILITILVSQSKNTDSLDRANEEKGEARESSFAKKEMFAKVLNRSVQLAFIIFFALAISVSCSPPLNH